MSETEIAWLAGLFEGEATFGYAGTRGGVKAVRITLAMTDRDVVERAYNLVGSGSFNPDKPKISKRFPEAKPLYVFSMASQSDCRDFMAQLLPYMGLRRQARMFELMNHIAQNPSAWNRGEGGKHGGYRRARTGCNCLPCEGIRETIREKARVYDRRKRGKA